MKKIALLILIIVSAFIFSACAYLEPNAKFTVTAIGFSAKGDNVTAYLQAIDFENSNEGGAKTFEITGTGENVGLALNDIKAKLSKQPSFEHCQIILLSDGIEKSLLSQTFSLCEKLGMSGRTKVVYTKNINKALTNNKLSSGADIVSLVKQNAETHGYGKHGALFEIETALLTNNGNFALVNIETNNNEIKFSGLLKYENGRIKRLLDNGESLLYAKEIN